MSLEKLTGICHFFTETGTEGGHWAFQDAAYIIPNTTRFVCQKCHIYWDQELHPDQAAFQDLIGGADKYCPSGDHNFELISKEIWSYDGLYLLKNGDHLTIYHPTDNSKIEWSGEINLQYYPVFTEDAFGWWIHADQLGIKREIWARFFLEEYPAEVIKNPNRSLIRKAD